MTEETSAQSQSENNYSLITQISVLAVACMLYLTGLQTPALSAISEAFPDYSEATIKLISSIPSLMLCIFSLLSGWMTTKISIKKCVYISMILMFVGVLPAFFGGMEFILFTRVVFGAGYGILFPMASALITDLFTGEKRQSMMGIKSAVGAAAGVVFQTLGGALTVIGWRYSFLGFLLEIPIAILVILFVPDTGVKAKEQKEAGQDTGHFTKWMFVLIATAFCLNVCQYTFMLDMSFVVTEDGLGTSVDAANALNMFTALAFVAGLIYAPVNKALKHYTPVVAILLVGIGMLIATNAQSLPLMFVAGGVYGLGFGLTNPALTTRAATCVTNSAKSPLAISIYTSAVGIGQFLSATICSALGGALGLTGTRADWQIASTAILVGCIIAFVVAIIMSVQKKQGTQAA